MLAIPICAFTRSMGFSSWMSDLKKDIQNLIPLELHRSTHQLPYHRK